MNEQYELMWSLLIKGKEGGSDGGGLEVNIRQGKEREKPKDVQVFK